MKNYQKTKSTIILLMVLITCISVLYGVCRYIGGSIFNKKTSTILKYEYGKAVTNDVSFEGMIDKLNVDIAVAELTVAYGDKLSVHYELPEELKPEITVKNGELLIRQKSGFKITKGISSDSYKVDIVLPKECQLVTCKLDVDCGNVVLEGLEGKTLDISADVGNVELKNMTFDELVVDADCGNVSVVGGKFNTIDTDVDLGNLELLEANFVSAKCDNDMGNITVEGTFDRLEADCNMGALEVRTVKPEEEVKLILNVDMGSIIVNGKKR